MRLLREPRDTLNEVLRFTRDCPQCQATKDVPVRHDIKPTLLPSGPWKHIAIDICGPFPDGNHVVIAADYYNRWPEAEITKDITSGRIINWLDRLFMRFGISEKLTSDNGRQEQNSRTTSKSHGINHLTTTPYWPRANGMVERLNRSFQSALEA